MEYPALEKPTAATSGRGKDEVIGNKKTGILVPSFAQEIRADQILFYWNNRRKAI